jgi:hypothetical protein
MSYPEIPDNLNYVKILKKGITMNLPIVWQNQQQIFLDEYKKRFTIQLIYGYSGEHIVFRRSDGYVFLYTMI